jgi:hypothetical protein
LDDAQCGRRREDSAENGFFSTGRQELAMPPTISLEQMTGFSLFMLKAVLSGRGDEVIDLARVNLFR